MIETILKDLTDNTEMVRLKIEQGKLKPADGFDLISDFRIVAELQINKFIDNAVKKELMNLQDKRSTSPKLLLPNAHRIVEKRIGATNDL